VLEGFVTKRRDKQEALKFLRKTLRRHGRVEKITTDKLRSNGAALSQIGALDIQDTESYANNRIENSDPPFRRPKRAMLRIRRMRSLQMFAAVHASVFEHFNLERAPSSRKCFKLSRTAALQEWRSLGAF
jgi:putative transposase